MALDHPAVVSRLVVLDAMPIIEVLDRCDARFARLWWHWFFFAQPEKPERAIMADPDAWYEAPLAELVSDEALAIFQRSIHNERVVHGMVEDYRAGLRIDPLHDAEDRGQHRRVRCRTLVVCPRRMTCELYSDPTSIWRHWVDGPLLTRSIFSCHHVAEEQPHELASMLQNFMT